MGSFLDTFSKTRSYFRKIGLSAGDYENTTSLATEFQAGGHYGIELSSMNNPKILRRAIELAKQYEIKISRVIECRGIVRLPDAEIKGEGVEPRVVTSSTQKHKAGALKVSLSTPYSKVRIRQVSSMFLWMRLSGVFKVLVKEGQRLYAS